MRILIEQRLRLPSMFKMNFVLQCYLANSGISIIQYHSNNVVGYKATEMVVLENEDCSFEITESCSPTIEGENNN